MAAARRYSALIRPVIFLGDLLVLNGLFFVLYLDGHFIVATWQKSWFLFLFALNLSWVVITFYANPYKVSRVMKIPSLFRDTLFTVFQHFLVTCTVIFLLKFDLVTGWGMPSVYGAFFFLLVLWRLSFFFFLRSYRERGYNFRNVIIVGQGFLSRELAYFFASHKEYGFRLIGTFDDNKPDGATGKINQLEEFLAKNDVDEIYCCMPYLRYGDLKRIIDTGEERFIKVKVIADFRAFSFKGLELERYDSIPVLHVSSIPLDDKRNQVVKRIFDFTFSLCFVVFVFSWLLPIVAVLIKLDSKGPVFFRQKRTGRNNEVFWCLKFRTMHVNSESDSVQAKQGDSRITKVGAFLRKSSIDEFPQFLNVLAGSMSVVGPRPHMLKHTEEYSSKIVKFMGRHYVKPGLTGLAQSKGYRGETQNIIFMKNRVRLDKFYIENWSFLLDIRIIFATVLELIRPSEKAI